MQKFDTLAQLKEACDSARAAGTEIPLLWIDNDETYATNEDEEDLFKMIFADGTEVSETWPDGFSPAGTLTVAVAEAEAERSRPHNGAWLEF